MTKLKVNGLTKNLSFPPGMRFLGSLPSPRPPSTPWACCSSRFPSGASCSLPASFFTHLCVYS